MPFDSPNLDMRARMARTPAALGPYVAFERTVADQLAAWPKQSAGLATGFIMSVWTSNAVKQGAIEIPRRNLQWIRTLGRLCGWRLKRAEAAWADEIVRHLLPAAPAG